MKMKPVMLVMMLLMIIAIVFAVQGVMMHRQVTVDEAAFHQNIDSYFIKAKSERDGAPAGSALNQQLVELQKSPSHLLQLKLVGVGKMLTGIFVLLFGILIALIMMPVRLGEIIKGH